MLALKLTPHLILLALAFNSSQSRADADNVAVKAAIDAKITRCLSTIKKVSYHVINGEDHGAHSKWDKADADSASFTSTIETVFDDGSVISSVTVTPARSGKCEVVISQMYHQNNSCLQSQKESFPKADSMGTLAERVQAFEHDTTNLYMVPTNPGCMILKKEHATFSAD